MQKKLPLINSAHGSETRNIINELIKLFNGMGYTYDEALSKAHNILSEARKTNDMNKDVQRQLDAIILENGDSVAEVVQARGSAPLLKDRLDKTDSQLSQTEKKIDIRSYDYTSQPFVSFGFDDAQITDYTRFKPIFESEGVPGSACVITQYIGTENYMTAEQLKELKALGWTVSSHTHTHPKLGDLSTEEELDYELKTSHDIVKSLGLDSDILVYPYGSFSELAIKVARKYYSYAIDIHRNNLNLPQHLNNMKISRVSGLSQPNTTLEQCKAYVDEALTTGNWVIFEDHSHYAFYGVQANLDLLRELIQYVKSLGIPIVGIREGIEKRANIIDVGNNNTHFKLFRDGSTNTAYQLKETNISFDSLLEDFSLGVSDMMVTNSQASVEGFPEGKGGTLITHKHENSSFAYQIYHIYNTSNTYKRAWSTSLSKWLAFERTDSIWKRSGDDVFNASSPLNAFQPGQITITWIISNISGFPGTGSSGILETHNFETYASYQTLKRGQSIYTRSWLSSSSVWSEWTKVTSTKIVQILLPATNVPANTEVEINVAATGVTNANFIAGNPNVGLERGVIYNVFPKNNGQITVRFYNLTVESIDLVERNWKFAIEV